MEKISCDNCGKKFDTQEGLKQHKNDAHKQAPVETVKSKGKLSRGKLLAISIPILVAAVIFYGVYWAITTEGVGALGSTHIHADLGVFLNGEELTPFGPDFYVASSYVHVEDGAGAGTVVHMHATGVPLKMFFNSFGMKFTPECFEVSKDSKFCNDGVNTLKMYVKHNNGTWEKNTEYEKFVFTDLDKILITYGDESDDEIVAQQNNVTDFSKDNSGRGMILRR